MKRLLRRTLLWLMALLLCALTTAVAQQTHACDKWKTPWPKADMPSISYAREATHCDAVGIYYGGGPRRFEQARFCAYAMLGGFRDGSDAQKQQARRTVWDLKPDQSFEDDDDNAELTLLLAMLYNNGEGVAPNLDVARSFVCVSQDWNDPDSIAASLKPGARLDECNEEGGSDLGRRTNYVCLSIKQGQVTTALHATLTQARRAVPEATLASFNALVAAHDRFRTANENEEPNGTSGAVQSGMFNELQLDRAWIAELRQIIAGTAPAGTSSASELAAQDKLLNSTYQNNLKLARENGACGSCTSEEEYRASARAWLVYREAWVRFGTARWPSVTADQWRAWLTAERVSDQGGN